jgi:biofilm PGA synthesis N-glycosyltransferase PgaC
MSKYVIITPARDEERNLEDTIRAILRQTVRPAQWIIVDDGSRDRTGEIIDSYAANYSWITALHRSNRGFRQSGGGVIDAFYSGYELLAATDWEFIVKLDADLSFSPDYFQRCFDEFDKDPRLGIGGGAIYHDIGGALKIEPNPLFHVRGATKIYRRACWDALGGLIRAPGWDTVDELKANMLGWKTGTFLHLQLHHHRLTGAADGAWKDAIKNGRANYITGYHPLFMLMKCVKRLPARPYVIGSLALAWGYLSGYFRHMPRVGDAQLINYTRNQQLRRLFLQESIWK